MFSAERPGTSGGLQDELLPGPPVDFNNLVLRRHSVRLIRHKRHLKVPLRAVRLCILIVLFPSLLVAVPLYMRFHVYGEQLYPVGISDMRLLDNRVSTTWCQVSRKNNCLVYERKVKLSVFKVCPHAVNGGDASTEN